MMAVFEIAYGITRQNEGGWHGGTGANSADRGGETFKGIARRLWPNWAGWTFVDDFKGKKGFPNNALNDYELSRMVRNFYRSEFWSVNRLDDIRSQAIANEMFDTGVNVGTRQSALWLQRSVNILNRNGTSWRDITVDGVIGNITLGVVNGLSTTDTTALFNLLNIYQGAHYLNLAERDKTQEAFIRGWVTRVEVMR